MLASLSPAAHVSICEVTQHVRKYLNRYVTLDVHLENAAPYGMVFSGGGTDPCTLLVGELKTPRKDGLLGVFSDVTPKPTRPIGEVHVRVTGIVRSEMRTNITGQRRPAYILDQMDFHCVVNAISPLPADCRG